ncbi:MULTISPECIES: PadR family transcriptional regulator [Ralstonia solanacearum species complex]|uniref:PadR family transcriptional regulator n=3 Tax=Ralstonia solanacearum TaxID=305 RepID=A0AAW5ZQH8_RALSL|nr:PadR family transcriptional regulator [Ralstonia solanacearum]AST34239.1 PadR family transcriptional regulator [Ralstonia solanacearum]ATJ88168.1 PadR family transcriptional regulator [Ralstonia solanacearum]MBB6593645.1 PadR family transcriptional regulator [Ralstonia solanacearum]MBB6597876.1 PadR family transcriptional regulator [Ralstonia solanacearum]MBT1539340.1 PadR family transcriptional regulator [Ralstonia solanacearum]
MHGWFGCHRKMWMERQWMMGRHHGGRPGFGRGFGGPGGFGEGDEGEGGNPWRGRRLSSADLQLVLLALLKDAPRHGYELIKAVEEHSLGFYAPSPGMVYPALSYLEDHGFASVVVEGNKKRYAITPEGAAWLAERQQAADAILAQLRAMGERVQRMNEAMAFDRDTEAADWSDAGGDPMRTARWRLKFALMEKRFASREEQQRVADILLRALKEITGH